jgi:hypothetical protein
MKCVSAAQKPVQWGVSVWEIVISRPNDPEHERPERTISAARRGSMRHNRGEGAIAGAISSMRRHRKTTEEQMTDYAESRDLEREFRRFQASNPNLYAVWSSRANDWTNLTRPPGEADRFDALCKLAATADGFTGADARKYWLNRVRLHLLARQSEHLLIGAHARRRMRKPPVGEPDVPEVERFEIHTIRPLCQACPDYCLERSSQARNEEHAERIEPVKSIKRRQNKSEETEDVCVLARRMRLE